MTCVSLTEVLSEVILRQCRRRALIGLCASVIGWSGLVVDQLVHPEMNVFVVFFLIGFPVLMFLQLGYLRELDIDLHALRKGNVNG